MRGPRTSDEPADRARTDSGVCHSTQTKARVAGADVAEGQWVGVVLEDGRFSEVTTAPTLSQLYDSLGPVNTLGVDIPIGLPRNGRE